MPDYAYYRRALAGRPLPLALVDLERFDLNAREVARRAGGKRVRVATKSVRSVPLLERLLASGPSFAGLLCYSAGEAVFLSGRGLDDLLVAYPVWQEAQVEAVCREVAR